MVTATDLDQMLKEVYGDMENLVPQETKLCDMIKFNKAKSMGEYFAKGVLLSNEQGFTYHSGDNTAFSLNSNIGAVTKQAQVDGAALVLQSVISYTTAAKAVKGKQAFVDGPGLVLQNMNDSSYKRIEIASLYGQSGIGEVDAISESEEGVSVLTIADAHWADGIWAGTEGAKIDIYNDSSKRNSSDITVSKVDPSNKQITVTHTNGDLDSVADGDDIYFKGAYGNECKGLKSIYTASSTLFNIDPSTYSLWSGNQKDVSGNLSLGAVTAGAALAVGKGLKGDVVMLVNNVAFEDLTSDKMNSGRAFDASYSKSGKLVDGAKDLEFFYGGGKIRIIPSIMVKQGDGFLFDPKDLERIGASDLTFRLKGSKNDNFFSELDSQAGFRMRAFSHQSIFTKCPGRGVYFSGITVS